MLKIECSRASVLVTSVVLSAGLNVGIAKIAGQQLQAMVALANWKNAPGTYLIQTEEMSVLIYGVRQQTFRFQVDTNAGVIDLREHLDVRTEPFSLIHSDHSPQFAA
ncbi:hypothetical protein ACTAB2_15900 [Pseudomonas syringae]|uniref:hypothetical protein n=1 Tax=Pseudomonas syringae TaxID=317 RepID=UPI003F7AC094